MGHKEHLARLDDSRPRVHFSSLWDGGLGYNELFDIIDTSTVDVMI